jgi:hypothetical protein
MMECGGLIRSPRRDLVWACDRITNLHISWAHVELVASLRKLKQAADTEYEDHRVEMACRC